jgi:hypothetical protein
MATLHSIAPQQAIVGILALAVPVPLATGAFDLSVGANIKLCVVLVAVLQVNTGLPMWPALLVSGAGWPADRRCEWLHRRPAPGELLHRHARDRHAARRRAADHHRGNQPYPPAAAAWSLLTQRTALGLHPAHARPGERLGHPDRDLCPGHRGAGLQFVTSVPWLSDMFNGVALIAAVALAGERRRASSRRRKSPGKGTGQEGVEASSLVEAAPGGAAPSAT